MHRKSRNIELSPVQISQVIAALRLHVKDLYRQESEAPESGAGNDVLDAESTLRTIVKVADRADKEDCPDSASPRQDA
jgi:hypothetical protein